MGVAATIVYVTLGRRRVDYRYVLLGAIAPDAVDGVVALFIAEGRTWRGGAHSLLAALAVALAVVLVFRGDRRLAVFGLAVGWLLHLVADGMWEAPQTFLWPAFGWSFAQGPPEPYTWDIFVHPLDHLGTWGGEVAGALLLVWFWVAFELGRDDRLRLFLRDGYLRP